MVFCRRLSGLIAVLLLVLPTITAGAAPGRCGQTILVDSRDGRIDREYPVACYRIALERLPEDLRVYGTAETDIRRALLGAVSRTGTPTEERISAAPAETAVAASGKWLAIAGGVAAVVGLVALLSLHSVRSRRRH